MDGPQEKSEDNSSQSSSSTVSGGHRLSGKFENSKKSHNKSPSPENSQNSQSPVRDQRTPPDGQMSSQVSNSISASSQQALSNYQRQLASSGQFYSPDQVAYLAAAAAAAAEHSALYMSGGVDVSGKDQGGLGGPSPALYGYPSLYHPYDPSFVAAAAAASYPFNGYSMEVNGSRRKNATRETTSTLKAWLNEHKKNPYPTKGEKIMLAIITKMTLTQVSTWFANARRRLKKENKMTWEPRSRPEDDEDVDVSDDEPDKKEQDERLSGGSSNSHRHLMSLGQLGHGQMVHGHLGHHHTISHGKISPTGSSCSSTGSKGDDQNVQNLSQNRSSNSSSDLPKPRIWSLADLAGTGSDHQSHLRDSHLHSNNNLHSVNSKNISSNSLLQMQNNLMGRSSAFSPLQHRNQHSNPESIYNPLRGLYPPLTSHHGHYHPDNP